MSEPDQKPNIAVVEAVKRRLAEAVAKLTAEVEPAAIYLLLPRSATHTDYEDAAE
jgi:hypothetical protein